MILPTFDLELALHLQGYRFVAGVDEAGRGAWAGPLVAAAVILPHAPPGPSLARRGVRDSKQLTPAARDALFDVIMESALSVGVGVSAPRVIDRDGIVAATRRAMQRAVAHLSPAPDYLILDYVRLTSLPLPQFSPARADVQHLSVAAASIVAKVTRDRLMRVLDRRFPGYGLAQHKGYGTPAHRTALLCLGPTPIHRMSFAPLHRFTTNQSSSGPANLSAITSRRPGRCLPTRA